MEKVLDQQEIDDMVRKARTGNAATSPADPVVLPWDVRQAGQIGSEQLRAINQLHETFARNLATAIGGYLRIVFGVSLVSAEHLTYRVEATSFLRHMVRTMVGTMVEIGRGKLEPGLVAELLACRERSMAPAAAPPQGLFLMEVRY